MVEQVRFLETTVVIQGKPRQSAWLGPQEAEPELSVVVGRVDGRVSSLRCCLGALAAQVDAPPFEVIVPYDEASHEVTGLADVFPQVRFHRVEDLDTLAVVHGSRSESQDLLKTIGLRRARAELIALTEDQSEVGPRWCRELVNLMRAYPQAAAFGGAVESRRRGVLARALYLCDFARDQNPRLERPVKRISDANVVYRREALRAVEDSWRADDSFRPAQSAMRQVGQEIWQTPSAVTYHSRNIGFWRALRERVVRGRADSAWRGRGKTKAERLGRSCLALVLPPFLTIRVVWDALRRRRLGPAAITALPVVFLLNCAWALGEFVGGVTASDGS